MMTLMCSSGFFSACVARIRGQPFAGSGWVAVATEGDEVEMLDNRTSRLNS